MLSAQPVRRHGCFIAEHERHGETPSTVTRFQQSTRRASLTSYTDLGVRLRRWRLRRGLSQQVLAELAGFTQGYVGQIETGRIEPDKLSTWVALADALQISVMELTGRPDTDNRCEPARIDAYLETLRQSLALLSVPYLHDDEPRVRSLVEVDYRIKTYFDESRYDRLIPALADAIADAVQLLRATDTPHRQAYQRHLADLCGSATSACMMLARQDLALVAAEHCHKIAIELAETGPLGIANYSLLKALWQAPGIARVAQQGIELLAPHVGRDLLAAEVYGMHHLMSAALAADRDDRAGALDHLAEAHTVARHTGECLSDRFVFGPANVAIWRLSIMSALGEGPAALEPSGYANPDAVSSASRLVFYNVHRATALLQTRGREREALSALLKAESLGPQLIRLIPEARAAVRSLIRRARMTSNADLRRFVDRIHFIG